MLFVHKGDSPSTAPRSGPSEAFDAVKPGQDLLFTDFVNIDGPDVLDTVKSGHDLLFTDFVDIDMPEVPDTVEPGHDLHFTDLVNVDICVTPTRLDPKTCLICYFDVSLGVRRTVASKFPRPDSMRRHARLLHFRKGQHQVCPDSACAGQVFVHLDHFRNHAEREHGVRF